MVMSAATPTTKITASTQCPIDTPEDSPSAGSIPLGPRQEKATGTGWSAPNVSAVDDDR